MDISLLLPLLLIVVLGGMFFLRNRQANKAKAEQKSKLAPGVDVMTNFGLFGKVLSINTEENKVVLETSPSNQVTVHSQTIGRIMEPPAAQTPANPAESTEPTFTIPDDASSLTEGTSSRAEGTGPAASTADAQQPKFGENKAKDQAAKPSDYSAETPEQTMARLKREAQGNTDTDK